MGTPISYAITERTRMHKAQLHPKWTKNGYRYAVLFCGHLIVENSRDPEHDAARALVAMGLAGKTHALRWKVWSSTHDHPEYRARCLFQRE